MPPFSREPGLAARAKGPGGFQDGHGGPGALVGAGMELQHVRWGAGEDEIPESETKNPVTHGTAGSASFTVSWFFLPWNAMGHQRVVQGDGAIQ